MDILKKITLREPSQDGWSEGETPIRIVAEHNYYSAYFIREKFETDVGWLPMATIGVSRGQLEKILIAMRDEEKR